MDCSCLRNLESTRFKGVVRDLNGKWVKGLIGYLDISTNTHAELVALKTGLEMAWEMGIKDLCCESDSKVVIELMEKPLNPYHAYALIVLGIKQILQRGLGSFY